MLPAAGRSEMPLHATMILVPMRFISTRGHANMDRLNGDAWKNKFEKSLQHEYATTETSRRWMNSLRILQCLQQNLWCFQSIRGVEGSKKRTHDRRPPAHHKRKSRRKRNQADEDNKKEKERKKTTPKNRGSWSALQGVKPENA